MHSDPNTRWSRGEEAGVTSARRNRKRCREERVGRKKGRTLTLMSTLEGQPTKWLREKIKEMSLAKLELTRNQTKNVISHLIVYPFQEHVSSPSDRPGLSR